MRESMYNIGSDDQQPVEKQELKALPVKFLNSLRTPSSPSPNSHPFPKLHSKTPQPTKLQSSLTQLTICQNNHATIFLNRQSQKKMIDDTVESFSQLESELSLEISEPLQHKKVQLNGNIFEGTWKANKLHGSAKIKYQTGQYFEGRFENGRKMEGFMQFKDGTKYRGNFRKNLFHGEGTIEDHSGRKITAHWVNGNIVGEATIQYKTGEIYKGELKNLKKHGRGRLWLKNGYEYLGEFENGVIQGHGKYLRKGETIAEGDWESGILKEEKNILTQLLKSLTIRIFHPQESVRS